MAATTAGMAFGGAAQAAPGSSVRACAVWENGRPYVGAMTLTTREGFWGQTRTLNSAPSGCMIWRGARPGKAYRVVVNYSLTCNKLPNSGISGTQTTTTGSSVWKVAPRSGQVELGKFVVQTVTQSC